MEWMFYSVSGNRRRASPHLSVILVISLFNIRWIIISYTFYLSFYVRYSTTVIQYRNTNCAYGLYVKVVMCNSKINICICILYTSSGIPCIFYRHDKILKLHVYLASLLKCVSEFFILTSKKYVEYVMYRYRQ